MGPIEYSPIYIRHSNHLADKPLHAERIVLGQPGDYKPMVAQLPGGELLLTAFRSHNLDQPLPDGRVLAHEDPLIFRSGDSGKTWSEPAVLDTLLGREPYLCVLSDGTLLMTVHLLGREQRNFANHQVQSHLHRSTDGGRTWQSRHIVPDEYPADIWIHSSRNVLELDDGSVIMGISGYDQKVDLLYHSTDQGSTWTHRPVRIVDKPAHYPYPFWAETVFWQSRSGPILAIARVSQRDWPIAGKEPPADSHNDQLERLVVLSSADSGATWRWQQNLGDYGIMYPSLLRLCDGRLVLTYTVRSLDEPLGVRALVGVETDDGFEFDFEKDVIIIDGKTPPGKASGGGFGNTIQLPDGDLLTPYSYRDGDDMFHLEIARWALP